MRIIFYLMILFPVIARASSLSDEGIDPQSLIFSVVKIDNIAADIFTADTSASHGTGFFIGIDPETKKGIIFTNKHVIEKQENEAQQLILEFNTNERRGERIKANLIYTSLLHDFAVVEFDPSRLKRADLSAPLHLPPQNSPLYDFVANERALRGLDVMAIGNPFDGTNVTTYGQITGLRNDPSKGPFIQTQTPINPGNSGGPLIALETGEVIGINTMTMTGADGTHWSIPIGVLMDEYIEWRQQKSEKVSPTLADPRRLDFHLTLIKENALKALKLYGLVEKAIPGYFNEYNSVLMVSDTQKGSGVESGDILLKMDDHVIGGFTYDFLSRIQRVNGSTQMQILRRGEIVNVKVDVPNSAFHFRRQEVDFVYISGLFIQEMTLGVPGSISPGLKSRLVVTGLVDSPEVNFGSVEFPLPGSVIVGVSFGGKEIPINNLFELKMALKQNQGHDFLVLHVYKANFLTINDREIPLISESLGTSLIDGVKDLYILPAKDILTPINFSLHKFKKQFDFSTEGTETRDWRNFVKKTPATKNQRAECESKLASSDKE